MNKKIYCPKYLTDINIINFIQKLYQLKDEKDLEIIFSRVIFVYPFATMLLAESLKDVIAYRSNLGLLTFTNLNSLKNHINDGISYLAHISFFTYIGIPIGNDVNFSEGSNNYLPIQEINRKSLESKSRIIQKNIQRKSEILSKFLIDDNYESDIFEYCFQEIIRNVFEHSESDDCSLSGQKWHAGKNNNNAEICIFDNGIGIFNSLKKNYDISSIEDAITQALKPGISSNDIYNNNQYGNAGFGLFLLSELGLLYGEFKICSNGVFYDHNDKKFTKIPYLGTGIKIKINLDNAHLFCNFKRSTIEKGEEEAENNISSLRLI